jgi:hypothetical protein
VLLKRLQRLAADVIAQATVMELFKRKSVEVRPLLQFPEAPA